MASKKATKVSPLTKELSEYIAQAGRRALPRPVVEVTKHHALDTLAAMVSGSKLLPGKAALNYVKTLGGSRECTVVGSKIVTNATHAALANGMLAHADETDDSHAASTTHPGCAVVAGALAMAERERSDGTTFLRAVTVGYDVACRMGMALRGEPFRRLGHSTHSMAPAFGAAAAGAVLARHECFSSCYMRFR
jgi:2-methylcitrate dehydratase PrpD